MKNDNKMGTNELQPEYSPKRMGPFRRAVLRGLGILLPPLLTIVILLWMGNTVADYLLVPMERSVRWVMVEKLADIRTPSDELPNAENAVVIDGEIYDVEERGPVKIVTIDGEEYRQTVEDGRFLPVGVYDYVAKSVGKSPMPKTATEVYTWYVNHKWLPREIVIPVFLCLFLLILYLLGKFLAAGVGRFFFNQLERIIHRVPLVRSVYGSVKQVTDFFFTESELQFTRVVAIEYPRKGIWTLAFVTGEGMWDICGVAKEPVITVFVPTSPMPFTGFALTVKKSEIVELTITVDQAIQFFVSCGVVVPPPIIGVPQKVAGGAQAPSALDVAR
jgi:uncharacterized membrane protein